MTTTTLGSELVAKLDTLLETKLTSEQQLQVIEIMAGVKEMINNEEARTHLIDEYWTLRNVRAQFDEEGG